MSDKVRTFDNGMSRMDQPMTPRNLTASGLKMSKSRATNRDIPVRIAIGVRFDGAWRAPREGSVESRTLRAVDREALWLKLQKVAEASSNGLSQLPHLILELARASEITSPDSKLNGDSGLRVDIYAPTKNQLVKCQRLLNWTVISSFESFERLDRTEDDDNPDFEENDSCVGDKSRGESECESECESEEEGK